MEKEITLDHPFQRGEQQIERITLQKPSGSGWLKGIKLFELMQLEMTALTTVLPRITTPTLTEEDIRRRLDPADLFQLGGAVVDFLLPNAVRESPTA